MPSRFLLDSGGAFVVFLMVPNTWLTRIYSVETPSSDPAARNAASRTERAGSKGAVSGLHSGGTQFESRPEHRVSRLRFIVGFRSKSR